MIDEKLLIEMDNRIQLMKKTANELNLMAENVPAIERNLTRIFASLKMLEINISDYLHL